MPATFVAFARCHIEDVATVANFLTVNGITRLSKSGIVSKGVTILAQMIRDNHPGMEFKTEDAMAFLEALGIDYKNQRGVKNLAKKLQMTEVESIKDDMTSPADQSNQPPIISAEDIKEAEKRRQDELAEHIKQFSKLPANMIDTE